MRVGAQRLDGVAVRQVRVLESIVVVGSESEFEHIPPGAFLFLCILHRALEPLMLYRRGGAGDTWRYDENPRRSAHGRTARRPPLHQICMTCAVCAGAGSRLVPPRAPASGKRRHRASSAVAADGRQAMNHFIVAVPLGSLRI
jgi:hypothetical protein